MLNKRERERERGITSENNKLVFGYSSNYSRMCSYYSLDDCTMKYKYVYDIQTSLCKKTRGYFSHFLVLVL